MRAKCLAHRLMRFEELSSLILADNNRGKVVEQAARFRKREVGSL